jgi:hypothetical protein
LAAVLLPGCAGAPQSAAPTQPAELGSVDPVLLEPLEHLPPCTSPPPAAETEPIEGLLLPDGAVVTSVTAADPLTTIEGYAPLTPIQLRVYYQRLDGVEVLKAEDEVWESETLITDGKHRLFVKAQAACSEGSILVAVVAPEAAAEAVPAPAGSPTSPPPGG